MRSKLAAIAVIIPALFVTGCTNTPGARVNHPPKRVSSLEGIWTFTWTKLSGPHVEGLEKGQTVTFQLPLTPADGRLEYGWRRDCYQKQDGMDIFPPTGLVCYDGRRFKGEGKFVSDSKVMLIGADSYDGLREGDPISLTFVNADGVNGYFRFKGFANVDTDTTISGIWSTGEEGYQNYMNGTFSAHRM